MRAATGEIRVLKQIIEHINIVIGEKDTRQTVDSHTQGQCRRCISELVTRYIRYSAQ